MLLRTAGQNGVSIVPSRLRDTYRHNPGNNSVTPIVCTPSRHPHLQLQRQHMSSSSSSSSCSSTVIQVNDERSAGQRSLYYIHIGPSDL